jgi:thymidylate synthase ThyX
MIEAKIILDSINPTNDRITSWLLTYPRFVHAELNTHRVFSRNASSSRAIPIKKMLEAVKTNPAMPVFWGKNQAGMQAKEQLDDTIFDQFRFIDGKMTPLTRLGAAKHDWLVARDLAVAQVEKLEELGLHKQLSNRLLESWMHITVLVTSTDFENFFSLRAHEDAQPELGALAYKMLDLYNASEPQKLDVGEWHIPFGDKMPENAELNTQLKISTARCARTSYLSFDGEMDQDKDFAIHDKLSCSGHWSPFEHPAQALDGSIQSGNFVGWKQYRKNFPSENRSDPRVIKKTWK